MIDELRPEREHDRTAPPPEVSAPDHDEPASLDELLAATERVDQQLRAERRAAVEQDIDDLEFADVVVTESGEIVLGTPSPGESER